MVTRERHTPSQPSASQSEPRFWGTTRRSELPGWSASAPLSPARQRVWLRPSSHPCE